jgi:hypothetical protein
MYINEYINIYLYIYIWIWIYGYILELFRFCNIAETKNDGGICECMREFVFIFKWSYMYIYI